jgi:hypothetical protein
MVAIIIVLVLIIIFIFVGKVFKAIDDISDQEVKEYHGKKMSVKYDDEDMSGFKNHDKHE